MPKRQPKAVADPTPDREARFLAVLAEGHWSLYDSSPEFHSFVDLFARLLPGIVDKAARKAEER